jgi:hypothetical protein
VSLNIFAPLHKVGQIDCSTLAAPSFQSLTCGARTIAPFFSIFPLFVFPFCAAAAPLSFRLLLVLLDFISLYFRALFGFLSYPVSFCGGIQWLPPNTATTACPALPLSHSARVFIAGDDRKKKKEGKKKRRTSLQLVNGLADEALVGTEWPINQAARHVSWMRFSDADIISLTRLCRH